MPSSETDAWSHKSLVGSSPACTGTFAIGLQDTVPMPSFWSTCTFLSLSCSRTASASRLVSRSVFCVFADLLKPKCTRALFPSVARALRHVASEVPHAFFNVSSAQPVRSLELDKEVVPDIRVLDLELCWASAILNQLDSFFNRRCRRLVPSVDVDTKDGQVRFRIEFAPEDFVPCNCSFLCD